MDNFEGEGATAADRIFEALVREIDRKDTSWRD